jgi:hypothetical protein
VSHLKDLDFLFFLALPIFCVVGEVLFIFKFTSLAIILGVLERMGAVVDSFRVPFYLVFRFIGITIFLLIH